MKEPNFGTMKISFLSMFVQILHLTIFIFSLVQHTRSNKLNLMAQLSW
jgi:hypothetical protein